jgi:hypothetical protein
MRNGINDMFQKGHEIGDGLNLGTIKGTWVSCPLELSFPCIHESWLNAINETKRSINIGYL